MRHGLAPLGLAAALALVAGPACAEGGFSWRGHPQDRCDAFMITETGILIKLASTDTYENVPPPLIHSELGVMANVARLDAVGASGFFQTSSEGFRGGARLRYRRWLSPTLGLDLAPGVTFLGDNRYEVYPSFSGSIGLSFNDWAGFAFDVEHLRPDGHRDQTRLNFAIHIGAQPGGIVMPLMVVGGLYGAALGASD